MAELLPPVTPTHYASKFSPELLQVICTALENGTTRSAAAHGVGIHRDTLYSWMAASTDISDAITRAEAACQQRLEAKLVAAASEDWRAASFWLERRRRAEYGPSLDLKAIPVDRLRELITGDNGQEEAAWPTIQGQQQAIEAADITTQQNDVPRDTVSDQASQGEEDGGG